MVSEASTVERSALEWANELVLADFAHINTAIFEALESQVPLAEEVAKHLIHGGGKRIRPLLLVLLSHALGYSGREHITLSVVIEFIHTATLLHDDVVDDSTLRRNRPTAHVLYGNPAAVLVGDFLYSRAFQWMVKTNRMPVMDLLSCATNAIAEGEVLQLAERHNPKITESMYFTIVSAKTGKLFEAASMLAGILGDVSPAHLEQLRLFGKHLGIAFQIVDDVLDYTADEATLGKQLGDDLAEGKATLPLIYAINHAAPDVQAVLQKAIVEGTLEHLSEVIAAIRDTGALDYAKQTACEQARLAKQALHWLPPSEYKDVLLALCDFAVRRCF